MLGVQEAAMIEVYVDARFQLAQFYLDGPADIRSEARAARIALQRKRIGRFAS